MNRNIERRYVAKMLCGLAGEHIDRGDLISKDELLGVLGVHIISDGGFVNSVDVCCLAELIDMPTCSNVDYSRHLPMFEPWFECSSCRCKVKLRDVGMPLRYCPFCGAEVVNDD